MTKKGQTFQAYTGVLTHAHQVKVLLYPYAYQIKSKEYPQSKDFEQITQFPRFGDVFFF